MHEEGFTVRFYRESDDEAMVTLLHQAYGRWPSVDVPVAPIDHLRWKLNSHSIAPRFHVVTEIESEIVGIRPFWARAVKARDRVLMLRQAVDGCVHPAHQRQGIAARVRAFGAEEFRRAFDLHFGGQSGHAAMKKMLQKDGQRPLGTAIEVWERSRAPDAPRAERWATPWTVSDVGRFDERVDTLWEEASRDFDFAVVRTKDYLNWRYADARGGVFTLRLAEEGGAVLGYAVLRVLRDKGYLADLLVVPGRPDVLDSLVADSVQVLRDAGAASIRYWTPARHPYKAAIARRGFQFKSRRKRHMTYLPLGSSWDELAFLQDPAMRLHFTIGDLDIV